MLYYGAIKKGTSDKVSPLQFNQHKPCTISLCFNQDSNEESLAVSFVFRPHVITVDKYLAYPVVIQELKEEKRIPEQDHRFIKKRVRSVLGLKSFRTASWMISGIKAMLMIKKEQIDLRNQSVQNQKKFIHQ